LRLHRVCGGIRQRQERRSVASSRPPKYRRAGRPHWPIPGAGTRHRRRAVGVYNTISCGDRWTRTPAATAPTTGLMRHAMRAPLRYVVRILFAILGIPQTERGFVFTS